MQREVVFLIRTLNSYGGTIVISDLSVSQY